MMDPKDLSSWTEEFKPMNIWECQHPGCPVKAVGTGGGIGLLAIGWYFKKGPITFCPIHRPDPAPADQEHHRTCLYFQRRMSEYPKVDPTEQCPFCKANAEAMRWQQEMTSKIKDEA